MGSGSRAPLFRPLGFVALASCIAVLCGLSSIAAPDRVAADGGLETEVIKMERDLERLYNSPEYARDPAVGLAYYGKSDDTLLFDIMKPGSFQGAAFRSHFIEVGKQFEGGKVEFLDLEAVADAHLAFVSMRQHFAGKSKDGSPFDITMLVTDCLRKESGRWVIVQEHVSLPLDIPTFMSVIKPAP